MPRTSRTAGGGEVTFQPIGTDHLGPTIATVTREIDRQAAALAEIRKLHRQDHVELHVRTNSGVPPSLLSDLGRAMEASCPAATVSACNCCDFRITGECS